MDFEQDDSKTVLEWVKDGVNHYQVAFCAWRPMTPEERRVYLRQKRRWQFTRYLIETGRLSDWDAERPALDDLVRVWDLVVEVHG